MPFSGLEGCGGAHRCVRAQRRAFCRARGSSLSLIGLYGNGLRPFGVLVRGRELHSFLLLPLIAEPNPDHVLLQVQLLRDSGDLLRGRPRLHGKVRLQGALLRRGDGRAFPLLVAAVKDLGLGHLLPLRALGLLQPGLEDRLQGHHVVVRQRQGFEPADGALTQTPHAGDLEVGQSGPHVGLSHPQFDPPLLEPLGEGLQLPGIRLRVPA